MAICGSCSGLGTKLEAQTCGKCHGLGTVRGYDHQGNPIDETCKNCSGSGIVDVEEKCRSCNGTGEV